MRIYTRWAKGGGRLGFGRSSARSPPPRRQDLGFITLGLIYHLALVFGPGHAHVHVHHWYWAWALTHICVFDSKTSQIAQAMFTGAYIHGVALFGVEQIFYRSADEDSDHS